MPSSETDTSTYLPSNILDDGQERHPVAFVCIVIEEAVLILLAHPRLEFLKTQGVKMYPRPGSIRRVSQVAPSIEVAHFFEPRSAHGVFESSFARIVLQRDRNGPRSVHASFGSVREIVIIHQTPLLMQ